MATEYYDKFDAFRQLSQLMLYNILDDIIGPKDLIIDGTLMKPLEKFTGVKALRSHGIDKIFKLDNKDAPSSANTLVYLSRADLITIKRICNQVNSYPKEGIVHLILLPKKFFSIERLIEEEGLFGRIKLHSFQWEFISIDQRVFSQECPEIFKYYFVHKDTTYTSTCAKSLWSLQHIFGKVPFKLFMGENSKSVSHVMEMLDKELGEADNFKSDIGLLLVADRDVDYPSVLLTPGTYTSLIGDLIGINTGVVDILKEDGKSAPGVIFNSEEETYNLVKHQHFSGVVPYLKQRISDFCADQARRNNMTIHEMREFVKNDLGKMANTGKTIANHLRLSEKIMNKIGKSFEEIQNCQQDILANINRKDVIHFIEELMATDENNENINLVARLIALFSICQNGFYQNEANNLKMQFCHAYGHENLPAFSYLEKMGLFSVVPSVDSSAKLATKVVQAVTMPKKNTFQTTISKLKLIPEANESYSLKNPQDAGYVFGGIYIPLLVQLIHNIIRKEKPLRELLKCLPNEFEPLVQGKSLDTVPDFSPRTIWVHVIGGISYAELAGFAFLEKKLGCTIICSGTSIITGNHLVESILP